MNIINGIVGALIGGSLVWVLGRAYGEGVGAAKSLFVVGKKAGNEDIKLYIDHILSEVKERTKRKQRFRFWRMRITAIKVPFM